MLGGRMITLAGICKGSGMIEPNMATMLAFVLTDAVLAPAWQKRLWQETVDRTFNRVTVDGETSTSDTAVLLANGTAGNPPLKGGAGGGAAFEKALLEVCEKLAKSLARDGEGATKLVTVRVAGAKTAPDAERAARRIANSLLVKTALFGGDANWGRILQTIGAARVPVDLAKTEVRLCGVPVFKRGASAGPAARERAQTLLQGAKEVELVVLLGAGKAEASVWTCDLSYDYVRINAEYRT
jgi:glutamate N-acetyltransferase/amino-acid N-acetyltransferase